MSDETDVRTYFTRHAPQIPGVTVRAINAVMRGGFTTMKELCAIDEERIHRIRNLGEKCFVLVLAMRKRYTEETCSGQARPPDG